MNPTLDLGDLANGALRPLGGIETAVAKLREWMQQDGSPIRAIRREPAREARHVPMPDSLDTRLQTALAAKSIHQLYTHQAEALEHALAGRNVVVVTPTASGKTLCYNLPVLSR